jgi:hypothetical protein
VKEREPSKPPKLYWQNKSVFNTMVSCKTIIIPSVLSIATGTAGFGWLIVDTERANNRFRMGVNITSFLLVGAGGIGLLVWAIGICENEDGSRK